MRWKVFVPCLIQETFLVSNTGFGGTGGKYAMGEKIIRYFLKTVANSFWQ